MRFIKLFIFFIVFFFVGPNAFAQQGCYVASENTIYTVDTGVNYTYYFLGFFPIGPYDVYSNPTPTTAPNCPRAQLGTSTGTTCWKSPTSALTTGTVYNYTLLTPPTLCPLDNNIIILIGFSSLVGFYMVRGRNVLNVKFSS